MRVSFANMRVKRWRRREPSLLSRRFAPRRSASEPPASKGPTHELPRKEPLPQRDTVREEDPVIPAHLAMDFFLIVERRQDESANAEEDRPDEG